ncbi:hypothetical protein BDV26DRAFT_278917 [Aspergillus bertholletiae]|uniref:Leucine-rich repeat domain-containing protein n=1 Tax=Aspergillus bertholletiae TaxID=1226010 RepID=A0A5N7BIE5_9EURO|nr:hypothetical protein BDV26DRAFT_278917 [Aspergillus bertholletiae]
MEKIKNWQAVHKSELLLSIASYLAIYTSLDLVEHRNGYLSHLVHTLASKPALAQQVRTLRVSDGWRPTSGVRYKQEVILPVLKLVLGPDDNLSKWHWAVLGRENNDVSTVLLLALLPDLEDLVLQVYDFSNYTLEWMARIAQTESFVLSKLRSFTAVCSDVDNGLSSSHFLPILRLPSLRSFCGQMICDGGSSDAEYTEDYAFNAVSYAPDNVGYSNVTHIHLNLESFIFEHSENLNYPDDESMYASRYYPPLCRHRETLQTLTITHEGTNQYTSYSVHDYDYIGSFAGFSALKGLRLQISDILDRNQDQSFLENTPKNGFSDVLPLSLESLILDGLEKEYTTELAKAFKKLLSGGKKYCCPNLTYLEIKGNWMHVQQSTEESNAKPRPIPSMLRQFADFKVKLELLCSAVKVGFRMRDLHVEDIIERNRLYGFWSDAL